MRPIEQQVECPADQDPNKMGNHLADEFCQDLHDPKVFARVVKGAFAATLNSGHASDSQYDLPANLAPPAPIITKDELKALIADPQITSNAKNAAKILYDNFALFTGLDNHYRVLDPSQTNDGITSKDLDKFVALSSPTVKDNYYVQKKVLQAALHGAGDGAAMGVAASGMGLVSLTPGAGLIAVGGSAATCAALVSGLEGYEAAQDAKQDQVNRIRLDSLHLFNFK